MAARWILFVPGLFLGCGVLLSCGPESPSESDFRITSIEFTGDSIGTGKGEPLSSRSLGGRLSDGDEPFCEFTILWSRPYATIEMEYTVFRSKAPGISENPSAATELVSTLETSWSDSKDLEWGERYYYAIMAETLSRDVIWSSEESVWAPESPYPEGLQLSAGQVGIGFCELAWTKADEAGFQTYTLLRSFTPGIEGIPHYLLDTLLVSDDIDVLSATDSTNSLSTRYYAVVAGYSDSPDPYSNEVEFTSSPEIPWRLANALGIDFLYEHEIEYVSSDNSYLLVKAFESTSFPPWQFQGIQRRSSASASMERSWSCRNSCSAEMADGSVAVGHLAVGDMPYLSILTDQLVHSRSMEIPGRAVALVHTPSGLLVSGNAESWLIDPYAMTVLETYQDLTFSKAVLSPEKDLLCIAGDFSGIDVLQVPGFELRGSIPGFDTFLFNDQGEIACADNSRACIYDPETLQPLDAFCFPDQLPELHGVSFLLPSAVYVYCWSFAEGGLKFYIMDVQEKVIVFDFTVTVGEMYGPQVMYSASDGSFLWGLSMYEMAYPFYMQIGI